MYESANRKTAVTKSLRLGHSTHCTSGSRNDLQEMWADDEFWMPLFLGGQFFRGEFDYSDEETIIDFKLNELPSAEAILA